MIPISQKILRLTELVDELRETINSLKEKEAEISYTHEDLVKLNDIIMIDYLKDPRVIRNLIKAAHEHILFLLEYANDFHRMLINSC